MEMHHLNEMVLGKGALSSLEKTQVDYFSFLFIIVVPGLNQEPCKWEARALPLSSVLSISSLVLRQGLTKIASLTFNSLCGSSRS